MQSNTVFECNQELQTVLEKQGFIETTSQRDKLKGKKEFRTATNSKFIIRFDYINFHFFEGNAGASDFGSSAIPHESLKLLLWYIKSNRKEKNEISDGNFKIASAKDMLEAMRTELNFYKENSFKSGRITKLSRMINAYETIQLN